MSFAKIAEARAVKKIVAYMRQEASGLDGGPLMNPFAELLREMADRIEAGKWKDIKLPAPKKKAKR